MRVRTWRTAPVAALAVGAALLVPSTHATSPVVCFVPVPTAVERALLVTAAPGAARAVEDVVASMGGRIGPELAATGLRQVELPTTSLRDAAVAALQRIPGVRGAEPERLVRAHREANDPLAKRQWAIQRIGLAKAWDVETGKAGVVVAVIDTGVALRHPDLTGKLVQGVDVVNDDDDPMDDEGHGTHVAGTVAAAANNRVGVAGVAWGAKVMPVKVLGVNGQGGTCQVAVGMAEAAQRGAQVLNLSLGGPYACPVAYRAAVELATAKGALVVASSGNDGMSGAPDAAPANCDGVLGVGATDARDRPGRFSSFGPTVDVSAPGVAIVSTTIDPKTGKHGYGAMQGTSMAAPHVAGLAALLKSRHPAWTPAQVADRITRTSDDLGVGGRDDFFGAGRINAARALTP